MTTAALMLLLRLATVGTGPKNGATVGEEGGAYDLTNAVSLREHTVTLLPSSVYYPKKLLTPETADAAVPESTARYEELGVDYLSQRFLVHLPPEDRTYELTFKLSGRHAMRVYVNGELAGQSGRPGTTKRDTEVWENYLTCYASPSDGKMDILLQSAQFYHSTGNARLASLTIGQAAGRHQGLTGEYKGFLMVGAFLCAAALLLCVYLLQRRIRATLYFSLACTAMALRECIQSQAWTRFPFISGNVPFMLEYLSVVLLTITLSIYLGQYASNRFLRVAQRTAILGSGVYGLCVLFGDSVFYTSILRYYQALLVFCIVPGVAGLFWKMRRANPEQAAAMFGIAVFYLAAVSDIFMYSGVLGYISNKVPVSEAAMLVFVLAQTTSLFIMNNRLIAEAREAERRLAAEKEALEALDRLKTEFLGNVSHELKTPLTVVSGHAQIARTQLSGPEHAAAREKMTLIASESDRLALMVGQILDLTRIEEGHMALERRPCHLDELIHEAVETHFPILNKNENRLEIRVEPGLPEVCVDPGRITQVLVNLISNAVRCTVRGLIVVAAREAGEFAEVSVSDNGEGIAPEELPELFTRFHSVGRGGTGTGLGLFICRHIVREHGGEITAQSTPGVGTKITFLVPLQQ